MTPGDTFHLRRDGQPVTVVEILDRPHWNGGHVKGRRVRYQQGERVYCVNWSGFRKLVREPVQ